MSKTGDLAWAEGCVWRRGHNKLWHGPSGQGAHTSQLKQCDDFSWLVHNGQPGALNLQNRLSDATAQVHELRDELGRAGEMEELLGTDQIRTMFAHIVEEHIVLRARKQERGDLLIWLNQLLTFARQSSQNVDENSDVAVAVLTDIVAEVERGAHVRSTDS